MVALWITGKFMNRLLILGILIISTAPLFAQAPRPNAAELAQKVVSIISGDKAQTQTYCQILDLSDELDQADQQKDREKAGQLRDAVAEFPYQYIVAFKVVAAIGRTLEPTHDHDINHARQKTNQRVSKRDCGAFQRPCSR